LVVGVEGGGVGVEEGVDVEGEFLLVEFAWGAQMLTLWPCGKRRLDWNMEIRCKYLV